MCVTYNKVYLFVKYPFLKIQMLFYHVIPKKSSISVKFFDKFAEKTLQIFSHKNVHFVAKMYTFL